MISINSKAVVWFEYQLELFTPLNTEPLSFSKGCESTPTSSFGCNQRSTALWEPCNSSHPSIVDFSRGFPSCSSLSASKKLQNASTSAVQPWKNTDSMVNGLKASIGFGSIAAAFVTIWTWSKTGYITAQTHRLICVRSTPIKPVFWVTKEKLERGIPNLLAWELGLNRPTLTACRSSQTC